MIAADGPIYASRRSPVFSRKGMVACSQPLAAMAGLDTLRAGGNAMDSAVAVAAALAVTEPCSTGLGGDCFCLFFDGTTRRVSGLNGSGRAPAALTLARAVADTAGARTPTAHPTLPPHHAHAVTVPGAAAGWADAHARWGSGKLSFAQVLAPAVALARDGFPVSPLTAHFWRLGLPGLQCHGDAVSSWRELTVDDGSGGRRAPEAGEVFSNPALASVLEELGRDGAASFYSGRVGAAIIEALAAAGGVMTRNDLVQHETTYPEAISTVYRGIRVHELPPSGQGLTALLALNILSSLPDASVNALQAQACTLGTGLLRNTDASRVPTLSTAWCANGGPAAAAGAAAAGQSRLSGLGHSSPPYCHALIEALRLAFADARAHIADPDHASVPVHALLEPSYSAARAALVDPERASANVAAGSPFAHTDTASWQVVDSDGNACSFINSNYLGFGSGIVPRGTGFSLQNRGAGFSLDPTHPNVLAPRKRPYHTIIPGLTTWADSGELHSSFSCMGGFMQPAGHVQLLINLLDHGFDPQTAIDLPRIALASGEAGGAVSFEDGIPTRAIEDLRARGHTIDPASPITGHGRALFGRAQIIVRDRSSGVLWGGSDGRGDGCAVGY